MSIRPHCPKCGSAAAERYTNHSLTCETCGHDGSPESFQHPGDVGVNMNPVLVKALDDD
jgi:ribosomal protein L37AE/L43A